MQLAIFDVSKHIFVSEDGKHSASPESAVIVSHDPAKLALPISPGSSCVHIDIDNIKTIDLNTLLTLLADDILSNMDGVVIAEKMAMITGDAYVYQEDSMWLCDGQLMDSDDLRTVITESDLSSKAILRAFNAHVEDSLAWSSDSCTNEFIHLYPGE